ncbi:DUF3103 family protein [Streptomyces sp. ODS05-4]|uniref:DUF3103 family protein n=1 Tax=Streptomyces sp. ODS05-4 TaxID=2944939 RepID=UPI00210B9530|nr:DUF3103 family protein [Streptomyces sp. ODS05-4]
MRAMVPLASSAVLLCTAGAGSAATAPGAVAKAPSATTAQTVTGTTDKLARELAAALGGTGVEQKVRAAVDGGKGATDLVAFAGKTRGLERVSQQAERGNADILRAKGLKAQAGSLIELRLGDESMRDEVRGGEPLLVAGEADEDARTIKAYDSSGRVHELDARTAPDRAVLVVGVNGEQSLKAGMEQLRSTLAEQGVAANIPTDLAKKPAGSRSAAKASGGYDATLMESVRLKEDREPWHKGGAEIYALVAGVNPQGEPQVDTVQMPYLDYDNKTYTPNQILINWSHFKFNAVDIVMMEEDTQANYAELARAVANGLLTVINKSQYTPLVDAIIKAIPQGWFSDDHDYVDSWYTIQKSAWDPFTGAASNGTIGLGPWHVDEV